MNWLKMREPMASKSKFADAPSQFTREFDFEDFDEESKVVVEDQNFRMVIEPSTHGEEEFKTPEFFDLNFEQKVSRLQSEIENKDEPSKAYAYLSQEEPLSEEIKRDIITNSPEQIFEIFQEHFKILGETLQNCISEHQNFKFITEENRNTFKLEIGKRMREFSKILALFNESVHSQGVDYSQQLAIQCFYILSRLRIFLTNQIEPEEGLKLLPILYPYCLESFLCIIDQIKADKVQQWSIWFMWDFILCAFPKMNAYDISSDQSKLLLEKEWAKMLVSSRNSTFSFILFKLIPTTLSTLIQRSSRKSLQGKQVKIAQDSTLNLFEQVSLWVACQGQVENFIFFQFFYPHFYKSQQDNPAFKETLKSIILNISKEDKALRERMNGEIFRELIQKNTISKNLQLPFTLDDSFSNALHVSLSYLICTSYFKNLKLIHPTDPIPVFNHILYYRFNPIETLNLFICFLKMPGLIELKLLQRILTATYQVLENSYQATCEAAIQIQNQCLLLCEQLQPNLSNEPPEEEKNPNKEKKYTDLKNLRGPVAESALLKLQYKSEFYAISLFQKSLSKNPHQHREFTHLKTRYCFSVLLWLSNGLISKPSKIASLMKDLVELLHPPNERKFRPRLILLLSLLLDQSVCGPSLIGKIVGLIIDNKATRCNPFDQGSLNMNEELESILFRKEAVLKLYSKIPLLYKNLLNLDADGKDKNLDQVLLRLYELVASFVNSSQPQFLEHHESLLRFAFSKDPRIKLLYPHLRVMLNHSFSVHAGSKNERRFLTIFHKELLKLFGEVKRASKLKGYKEADQETQSYYEILEFINGTFNRSLKRQNEPFYRQQILLEFIKTLKVWIFGNGNQATCDHPYFFHTLFLSLKKLKSFNKSYDWGCSLQSILVETVDSLNYTLRNNFKAGINLQQINAALSLIKLEQMFGKVPRLFDSVRRLLEREIRTKNFKEILRFVVKTKDEEWLQKIQDWAVGEPQQIYKEYIEFSSSKARIQLSNLPPFHTNCNSFTVSYLQCFQHTPINSSRKNDLFSLIFIQGMEIGKDDVVAELKAEPDLDLQENEPPRHKLSISSLISTESINLRGNWCLFSLNFKVKSGQRIARVRLFIQNEENEFTEISFTPVSQNFWLKRVSIEATNSLMGPIMIGKQPGCAEESSFQVMRALYKSEATDLEKNRLILTPRMLLSCHNSSNLLSTAYYPQTRYSNFSTSLKKFQATNEHNYLVECRVQFDSTPSFKVVEQLRESFAKFDGYLYLIPYLNEAVIGEQNRPLLISQIRFFIQFLEISIKENKHLVNYEQSFQFLELSLHQYVGDLSALSKEIFNVYQAFELEQRQYYAQFFIRLVLHPKTAPYAFNNQIMIRQISNLYKKSLHDTSGVKHEHHFNILARLVDFLSYNLLGSSKFLLSGNQMIQTDLFNLIFNLNKTGFVEVVHEKILRERSGKILVLLLWIMAKISSLVLQKKQNTSIDKQLLKQIRSSEILNTLLLSEVHTIFEEEEPIGQSVIFKEEEKEEIKEELGRSRISNRSNYSIRSFLSEEIKVHLNHPQEAAVKKELGRISSSKKNIMVYSFKDSSEYAQALNLAMRLHFNLKVAEIQRGSNSISLLFFGKEGIVKQIEQQIQELLERFDRYKPPLHEQTLKNLKKFCIEVIELFEENGVAEVFSRKFMLQQFYYRIARLIPQIDPKAISVFLSFYENQPSIPHYLQICIFKLLSKPNYGLLKILIKELSSYSQGRHYTHLIDWSTLFQLLKIEENVKTQSLKFLAQTLIEDCLYEKEPDQLNSTVIFGVIEILEALTQAAEFQHFIKESLKTLSKLMNYELLLLKDNYHCSSKILGICFYFLHQDIQRGTLSEDSFELISCFLFTLKKDNQIHLNREFQTALDLLAIDESSSNLNFTNSGAIFIFSQSMALILAAIKQSISPEESGLFRFFAKLSIFLLQTNESLLVPKQFNLKLKYCLNLEQQPTSVITSKIQPMKKINQQILPAEQTNSFFQSFRSLADKSEIVTEFLNESQDYITGKLMPSLFHLSSRKIINQIKWPNQLSQASIKELMSEMHSVLSQRHIRKNSNVGSEKQNEFLSISQHKKRIYRKTHLENIEQQEFKIKILQKSIKSYSKELTKVPGSIWYTSLKSDFNLCKTAFKRMNEITFKNQNIQKQIPKVFNFDYFTKQETLSDSLGRRLFLKERRKFHKDEQLDIAYPNVKKYMFRKLLAFTFLPHRAQLKKKKLKTLRYLLSRQVVAAIFRKSMKCRQKVEDSVVGFVKQEQESIGRDLKANLEWRVILKKAKGKYEGVVSLHDRYLQFQWGNKLFSLLLIEDIEYAIIRRHEMQRKAIEIFSKDGKSYKYCFNSLYELSKFCRRLQHIDYENKIKNQTKGIVFFRKPQKDFEASGITQKWQDGDISNFQYLWLLNFFSDRSFNDLSCYPVFPWICNFKSPLTIESITKEFDEEFAEAHLRNLAKPTALMSEMKRKRLETQLRNNREFGIESGFGDDNARCYYIREPYSCRMIILQHLVRLQPITSRAISFDNSLDVPDRQFLGMQRHYKGVLINFQDNKELTPEFYYNPQFLRNHNFIDFGVTQWGQIVHDVDLPAPFKLQCHGFSQFHRMLLESNLVTNNMASWIDLIFGYYQQNKHQYNIYPWYGSEEYIAEQPLPLDPFLVHSIDLFQQIPIKLFKHKHPQSSLQFPKTPKSPASSTKPQSNSQQKEAKVDTMMSVKTLLVRGYRELWHCREESMEIVGCSIYTPNNESSLLSLVSKASSEKYLFILVRSKIFHFSNLYSDNLSHDLKALCNQNLSIVRIKLGTSEFSRDEVVMQLQDHPASLRDAQSFVPVSQQALISVGHFNNSLCFISLSHPLQSTSSSKTKGKIIMRQKLYSHDSFVTCGASDSKWTVTGSQNGVVILWNIAGGQLKLEKFFCDHDEPVVAVAVNAALSVLLSIDESGTCYVRHLPSKRYLKHLNLLSSLKQSQLRSFSSFALKSILISKHGYFSFCIRLEKSYLFKTFSCNGEPVSEISSRAPIKFVTIDPSHDFFFVLIQVQCWKIHVFNLITLEELQEDHPFYPPGIAHTNCVLAREDSKSWVIRSMHALEDVLIISLGDKILQLPKSEKKLAESQWGRRINLGGYT